MKSVVLNRASVAWLALIGLTLISWALGTSHGQRSDHEPASLLIIIVAVFKVRLVAMYFMELRDAPGALRRIFEGYCAALPILLGAIYLLA